MEQENKEIKDEKLNEMIDEMNKAYLIKLLFKEQKELMFYSEMISRACFLTRWYWRCQLNDALERCAYITSIIKGEYEVK